MNDETGSDPFRLAEIERLQVSCDLHDGILQVLVGARLVAESLRHGIPRMDAKELASGLNQIEEVLRKGIEDGRRWIGELRGEFDVPFTNLEQALNRVVEEARQQSTSVTIYSDFDPGALNVPFSALKRKAITRIAQESIRNALRHSKARSISISLSHEEGTHPWSMTVADDGVGFDVHSTPKDHYGLLGMQTRAQMMDGILTVDSTPGKGTRIVLSL